MGLFSKKEQVECAICGNPKAGVKLADGEICINCVNAAHPLIKVLDAGKREISVAQYKATIDLKERSVELYKDFIASKSVGGVFAVDQAKKQWCILPKDKTDIARVYDYDSIQEYELLEDGETVTKGGLGRAVVGGIALGGVGAIVGGITGGKKSKSVINSLRIKITMKDMSNPVIYIDLLKLRAKQGSMFYKEAYANAQEILSVLSLIVSEVEASAKVQPAEPTSNADQLIKLKGLLDAGVLTQEEFDAEKQKVLSS